MSLSDELEKLQQLHRSGVLSDREFAKAKAALLDGSAKGEQVHLHVTVPDSQPASSIGEGLFIILLTTVGTAVVGVVVVGALVHFVFNDPSWLKWATGGAIGGAALGFFGGLVYALTGKFPE